MSASRKPASAALKVFRADAVRHVMSHSGLPYVFVLFSVMPQSLRWSRVRGVINTKITTFLVREKFVCFLVVAEAVR